MIPFRLNVVLLTALAVFFITIMLLLKDRRLDLKYALLWLFTWLALSVLVIFPDILAWCTRLIGIRSNMNGLYIALIAFILLLLLAIFSIVSGQKERIRKLAEENALLEERIRKLEEQNVILEEKIRRPGEENALLKERTWRSAEKGENVPPKEGIRKTAGENALPEKKIRKAADENVHRKKKPGSTKR